MTKKCILHSSWTSSCSHRVRIALALKGIKYDYQAIRSGEQLSEEYTKLNPNQRVPTLEIDGYVLTQSMAILEYLEETRSSVKLLPSEVHQRAVIREICGIIGSDIQPLQNLGMVKKLTNLFEDDKREKIKKDWVNEFITRGFQAVETRLQTTAGKYSFGDVITLADVFLVPQVDKAIGYQIDLTLFPTIQRIYDHLQKQPAFQEAHPTKMPDAIIKS